MRRDEKLELRHRDITLSFDRDRPADGASFSGHERDHLFVNHGFGESFVDISGISGLDHEADSRVSGLFDFNRDGWVDIAVASANRPMLRIYRNDIGRVTGRVGRFVAVRFVGGNGGGAPMPGLSPRDGYGAKVRVEVGDRTLLREHHCGEGFAGQNSTTMLIGIGEQSTVDLTVAWPGGVTHALSGVGTGSLVTAYEVPRANGSAFETERYPAIRARDEAVGSDRMAAFELPAPGEGSTLRVYTTMATWCASCKREIPSLHNLRKVFSADQMALFGVPVDPKDTPEMLGEYRAAFAPPYTLLESMPRETLDRLIAFGEESLKGEGVPMSFVLDADGRVRLVRFGVPTVSELRKLL